MQKAIENLGVKTNALCAAVLAASLLSACGGGGSSEQTASASSATQLSVVYGDAATESSSVPAASAELAPEVLAQPLFHVAPVLLDPPDDSDALDNTASARSAPRMQRIPAAQAGLSSQRLTLQAIQSSSRMQAMGAQSVAEGTATPFATGSTVTTYTPAQIRAAYGLPAMPLAGVTPTAAQAAQLGAGQTIYIVDAMHDPNVVAELNAFNQKFGLPACVSKTIPVGTSLPLAAATAKDGCVLYVAYTTTTGALTNTAPAYDAGWATEIALDVQWVHATAPLARIVLIEAPDSSVNSLLGGIRLANLIGPGIVSMSFGAGEGSWTSQVDASFAGTGMSYLAATGDSGAAVSWPAVSSRVLAVGGTTLSYSSLSARKEVGWAKTGGGISAYVATPAYQARSVPGVGSLVRRSVADVAFNADPMSGQFVSVIKPGTTTVNWLSAGGTSLATPQWAGLIAIANAIRAQASKSVLGATQTVLYGQIGAVPGVYAAAFADITSGTNGTCATCSARIGYDSLTGLGSPNVSSLLSTLSGVVVSTPPVVSSASISGKIGTPLSFNVTVTAANPVSYSLSGAPTGMAISSTGTVSWATPVAGTYAVTVNAQDSKTQLIGQGAYTITIQGAQLPPVIKAAAMTGVAGKPLTGAITVSDPGGYAMSISITGVPLGVIFSISGQTITASWAKPVTGKYTLNVTVKDAIGLSAQLAVPITISAK